YQIFISPGQEKLVVFLMFSHEMGDIDIEVYNSSLSVIVGDYSVDDNEFIDYVLPSSGLYYLKIYYQNNGNKYNLLWDAVSPSITDDYYEPNDGPGTAYPLVNNTWLTQTGNGLGIHSDDDYYQIYISPGNERLKVDLIFSQVRGDMDIEILNSSYIPVAGSWTVDDNEFVNVVLPSGIYYIHVYYGYYGGFYNLIWHSGPPDDLYEENDFFGGAYDLRPWDGYWLPYGPAFQVDHDWYEVWLDPGEERIYAELSFSHIEGDIDMEVYYYNGSLTWLAGSYSPNDNEYIDVTAPWSGSYYILVYGPNLGTVYDLYWEDRIPLPPEDIYEENDFWTDAYDISGNESTYLMGILKDDDWYKTYVDWDETRLYVEVSHSFLPGQNIEFEIYYYNGVSLDFITRTNDYWIDTNVPSEGWYYIHIYGDNAGNQYYLWWEDSTPYDDSYEENDFEWEAYYLVPFAASWLPFGLGIQLDEDWYEVYLDPGEERIIAELNFSHSQGNIDMEIWYWDAGFFTLLAGSYSYEDYEYIDVLAPWAGNYYILVFGDNSGNYYDLWWEDLSPGAVGGDDQYEENEVAAEAYDLTSYDGWWLTRIMGEGRQFDIDWYKFNIGEGVDNLVIELNYNDREGDINIELYDSNSVLKGRSDMRDGHELIELINPASGMYYFRIYGHDMGNWYNLYWSAGGLVFYGDDFYEDNNNWDKAYGLWDDEKTWLSDIAGVAVQGDEDWYMIEVTPHFRRVVVELEFNFSQGDINLALYNYNNILLAENTTNKNEIRLNFTVGDWGEFFIQITGDNAENEYDLWWDDIRTDFGEDAYEQNDDFINATD
ncbi:hypothetical protein LCGC14_1887710, partial [marine sediment metagenome]